MSDEEYFEQLCSNSLDGTLTDAEREKLEAHLAECPSCAALKQDLEQMRTLLAGEVEPPAGLHEGIMQRLEQENKLKVVQPEKPARRMPVFTMVAAAAVVVLVVLGGGLLPMFSTVGGTTAANTTTAEASAAGGAADSTEAEAAVRAEAAGSGLAAGADSSDSNSAMGNGAVEYGAQAESGLSAPVQEDEAAGSAVEAEAPAAGGGASEAPSVQQEETALAGGAAKAMPADSAAQTVEVPESLRAMAVSHCYLAQGGGELPDIGGKLLSTDGQTSWFLLDNDLATIQDTLGAVEDAGFTVSAYTGAGLTIDSKASSWLLIVSDS